ncbi:hypothetical protein NQ315_016509 [Exocentrus adspersus]|uniref:Uncharacterized protein n=1 Tax=Exocentrus adspersus TaxID=1586481 RepID=A0AAV8W063_9CUCU|nr:hypothetical protein NQ315_016509 [Exocentrus adspersus]
MVSVQLKMVNGEFERLFRDAIQPEKELDIIKENIKECVDHHNFLLDYVRRINNIFSVSLLFYFGSIVIFLCGKMYRISIGHSYKECITSVLAALGGLTQFGLCYCFPAQMVTNEGAQDKNAQHGDLENVDTEKLRVGIKKEF